MQPGKLSKEDSRIPAGDTLAELTRLSDEMKAQDTRQNTARREAIQQIAQQMELMAKAVNKLAKL